MSTHGSVLDLPTLSRTETAQLGQALDLKTSTLGRVHYDPMVGVVFVPDGYTAPALIGPGTPTGGRLVLEVEEAMERLLAFDDGRLFDPVVLYLDGLRDNARLMTARNFEISLEMASILLGAVLEVDEVGDPSARRADACSVRLTDDSRLWFMDTEKALPLGGFAVPDAPAQPKVEHFDGDDITTDTPAPERLLGWLPEGWRVHKQVNHFYGPNGEQVFNHGHGHVVAWGSKHEGVEAWTEWTECDKRALVLALAYPEAHLEVSDALQAVLSNLGLSERYAELWSRYKGAAEPELMTTIETIREAMSLSASFRRVLDVLPEQIQAVIDRMPEAINAVAKLVEEKGGQPVYQDPRVAKLQARVKELEARVQELEATSKIRKSWEFGVIDDEGDTGWRRVTKVGTFFAWDPPSAEDGAGWSFWAFNTDEELDDQLAFEKGLKDAQAAMEAAEARAPELIRTAAITLAEEGAFGLPGWSWEGECWVLREGLAIRGRALPGGLYYVVQVLGRGVDHPEGFQEGKMAQGQAGSALEAMEDVSRELHGLGATLPSELEDVLFGRTRLGD